METFVNRNSIVRTVWGKSDTVLFIFAGAAAEFALNKAVDWLYFTGRLPADPIGRLFSTVAYARRIIFSDTAEAHKAIDTMSAIHAAVEGKRGASIPDWAYRDVLFMLIHYSIASYELLERKLAPSEKAEIYDVFFRVGTRMGLQDLPATYTQWLPVREAHLHGDLQKSRYTTDLFLQYRKHLGAVRFSVLKAAQALVVPPVVEALLGFPKTSWLAPFVPLYRFSRRLRLDGLIKALLLPAAYQKQIKALDVVP